MLRELEEGCDIRIGRLGQMMNGMAVEKHADLAFKGGGREKVGNIHFVTFFSR